jgi:KaiC/GvpD/RAD55 family RecA-like ATPase
VSEIYIPQATVAKLNGSHVKGTRHKAAMDMAIPLIGSGLSVAAVFQTLRDKFAADVTDNELRNVVSWAAGKNPTPSGFGKIKPNAAFGKPFHKFQVPKFEAPTEVPARTPVQHAEWWLNGATMNPEAFQAKSQLAIPEDRKQALVLLLEMLYLGTDNLNVVCKFSENEGKARPSGGGKTQTRDKWVDYVNAKEIPESKAGAWLRLNPCKPVGSGQGGAVTDSDIVSHRFLLLESDVLPLPIQFSLFARLALPIAAVLSSGGQSIHAWLRLDAPSEAKFSEIARRVLTALAPFGIDQANKNPSRLSRLPGATRIIGGVDGGAQRLFQLNPGKAALTEDELAKFEDSLLMPAIEDKPFHKLVKEAVERYAELAENVGKTGVMTGFKAFDSVSGGLKPGGYTLIAAQTGVGKSTLALNIFNHALRNNVGVALFSLEMSRDDVTDMMFSINCNVNRNNFNTGNFTTEEMQEMIKAVRWMKNLPLWVEDDPAASLGKIRARVLQLKSEDRIGLVVVDYAQLAIADSRPDSREQAVAEIALGLRLLGREAEIPVIVLSQLNDDNRVRESRKLAHEAANLFILERDSEKPDDPNMTLKVVKGRKIPSKPIKLHFKAEFCRITERSPVSDDEPNQRYAE